MATLGGHHLTELCSRVPTACFLPPPILSPGLQAPCSCESLWTMIDYVITLLEFTPFLFHSENFPNSFMRPPSPAQSVPTASTPHPNSFPAPPAAHTAHTLCLQWSGPSSSGCYWGDPATPLPCHCLPCLLQVLQDSSQ